MKLDAQPAEEAELSNDPSLSGSELSEAEGDSANSEAKGDDSDIIVMWLLKVESQIDPGPSCSKCAWYKRGGWPVGANFTM